jgi:glucose-1-phosphate thymidylyltransferase
MVIRKGIVLAGGAGSRLHPITRAVSKQLLPIYDKPMIYFPLSVLMLSNIRDILVITTPHEQDMFVRLLGDGSQFGVSISYATQPNPGGLAQAFLIGEDFIGSDYVSLVLGDNIFYGHGLSEQLERAAVCNTGATIFAYYVKDPERYGVLKFENDSYKIADILEKPAKAPSHWAVTGLYYYDNDVVEIAKSIKPSPRGELEITDINRAYLKRGDLQLERIGRGYAWLDTGTHESLLHAGTFIQTIQERQGLQVACLEEIAFHKGYINTTDIERIAEPMKNSTYGQYLLDLIQEPRA